MSVFAFAGCQQGSDNQEKQEHHDHDGHEHHEGEAGHDDMHKEHMDEESMDENKAICPMHPEITGEKGDDCSKCGMQLVPVEENM